MKANEIQPGSKEKEPETLAGIWENKGFEKIADLDKEIKNLRKEWSSQILKRHKYDCNS